MKTNQAPNCAICEWHLIQFYDIIGRKDYCAAQGNQELEKVYNNKMCKKLYKIKGGEFDRR